MEQLKKMIDSVKRENTGDQTSVELVNNNLMRTTLKNKPPKKEFRKQPSHPPLRNPSAHSPKKLSNSPKKLSTPIQSLAAKSISELDEPKRKVLRRLYERKCAKLLIKVNE